MLARVRQGRDVGGNGLGGGIQRVLRRFGSSIGFLPGLGCLGVSSVCGLLRGLGGLLPAGFFCLGGGGGCFARLLGGNLGLLGREARFLLGLLRGLFRFGARVVGSSLRLGQSVLGCLLGGARVLFRLARQLLGFFQPLQNYRRQGNPRIPYLGPGSAGPDA